MLDLTAVFTNTYYELKMLDGQVLNLKRPTQGIQQSVLDIVPYFDKKPSVEAIEKALSLFTQIINNNVENIEYTEEQIKEDYSLAIVMYVFEDYFRFWNEEVNKNVNFHHAQ